MQTPHFIFWAVGVMLILAAIIFKQLDAGTLWPFWSELSLNVGISVLAVSIVDFLWRRVGGDPILAAIERLRRATALLSDLDDSGMERLFCARRDPEAVERQTYLKNCIVDAEQVDLMGIALRHNWTNDDSFLEMVRERISRDKGHFRILVLDPNDDPVRQRDREERKEGEAAGRISADASSSLSRLAALLSGLTHQQQGRLQIRTIHDTNIYCSVVRVDDRMLVTKYLLAYSGSNSPTFEIAGRSTELFKLFEKEFEAMWQRAR